MSSPRSSDNYRWFVLGIIMLGTFMAILDSSIVNVALPHMMSAFEVNRDQIEWVSTAFMLALATAMPLVGWLVGRVGFKALYLSSLALFTAGSAVCAFAWSYDSLVAARVVQAIGGGAIQPVGMAFVARLFQPHERGKALGIWGTGIMVAPALGPTLGGYLTDWFNWRAIFSVNLPIGAVALLLGMTIMRSERSESRARIPFDVWGFTFISMALISGLLALSKGQSKGWSSAYIQTCLAFTVVGFVMFLAVESVVRYPLLDLRLFRYRNFTLSIVLAVFRAVGLFGSVFLLPIFLQNLVGYTTIRTGLTMMPGAIAVGISMPFAGRLADRYGPRNLVTFGVALTGLSLLAYGRLDPLSSRAMLIGPLVVRGVGLAFMMAPLITAAINAVPKESVPTASSFMNVAQSVGGSFGIALLNTYVTNSIHRHGVRIGELMSTQSETFARFTRYVSGVDLGNVRGVLPTAQVKALTLSARGILHRADVLGFENGFMLGGLIVLSSIALCLLLQHTRHRDAG
jgi:EmrB/QacA subfamily drug resistance transporter